MRVGIVSKEINNNEYGITAPYVKFLSNKLNAEIIPLPLNMEQETWNKFYSNMLNLVVLVGGQDVDPLRYGQKKGFLCGNPDYYLEDFDRRILPLIVHNKIPLFGICRGFQTINVHFGGTLIQHLNYHPTNGQTRSQTVHSVFYNTNNSVSLIDVNSLHHQGIDKLGRNLKTIAWYSKDKKNGSTIDLIEAFSHNNLPIAGVQWHPEELGGDIITNYLLDTIL